MQEINTACKVISLIKNPILDIHGLTKLVDYLLQMHKHNLHEVNIAYNNLGNA